MKARFILLAAAGGLALAPCALGSIELPKSYFAEQQSLLRYGSPTGSFADADDPQTGDDSFDATMGLERRSERKSPAKGFIYSMLVPGLGQFYYGSKIKPLVFLSAEAVSWGLFFKWHGEGDDLTAEFEQFNRDHWSRQDYQQYLEWSYSEYVQSGEIDDEWITEPEISHHLPDNLTQQYYEMTGKYDQFAWAWDDATLNGNGLYDYDSANAPPRIGTAPGTIPYSARRLAYEGMRDNANKRYNRATRMVFVSLANRLISAFEALFTIKNRNNKAKTNDWSDYSQFKVRARLKSYYSKWDTPFLVVSRKF